MIKRLDNNLLLVIIFTCLFLLTGFYLFAGEKNQHDYNKNKEWTACYLASPGEKGDLSFTIENYEGVETEYAYSVVNADGQTVLNEKVLVRSSEKREIKLPDNIFGKRVIITYPEHAITLMNP